MLCFPRLPSACGRVECPIAPILLAGCDRQSAVIAAPEVEFSGAEPAVCVLRFVGFGRPAGIRYTLQGLLDFACNARFSSCLAAFRRPRLGVSNPTQGARRHCAHVLIVIPEQLDDRRNRDRRAGPMRPRARADSAAPCGFVLGASLRVWERRCGLRADLAQSLSRVPASTGSGALRFAINPARQPRPPVPSWTKLSRGPRPEILLCRAPDEAGTARAADGPSSPREHAAKARM